MTNDFQKLGSVLVNKEVTIEAKADSNVKKVS